MSNLTANLSNSIASPDTLVAYTVIILFSDVSSILIRLLLCAGMVKCQRKCNSFDVSCLIVANLSFCYGILSWIAEYIVYSVDAIQLTASLSFICYLINARQIFWVLSNHSLVFLSLNRVFMIHRTLCTPVAKIHKSTTGWRRWRFSIGIHGLNFLLLLAYHLTGYFTGSVIFKKWNKCSKKNLSDTFVQINYFLRNLIPCLAMAINYVVLVPFYLVWHVHRTRSKKLSTSDQDEKRVNKVIKLSLMHLIYTLGQASSWLILTGVTEFILRSDTEVKSNVPRPVTMFELFFGTLKNETMLGAWWLELFSWLYMILDSFNPLILIMLHTHLHQAVVEILSYGCKLVVILVKSLLFCK